jgi:hypothetical protein
MSVAGQARVSSRDQAQLSFGAGAQERVHGVNPAGADTRRGIARTICGQ